MSTLSGKTALITGGNSGIGYATAQEFIAQGARVVITGRNADSVAEAARTLGSGTIGIVAEQADLAHLDNLATEVKSLVGNIDVLFLNAGAAGFSPLEMATEAHYDEIMNINVKGVYFTVQKLLPLINDGGSILFNTSVNASVGMAGSTVYSASKASLLAITRVLAVELSARGIRVNSLSPGPVETPLWGKVGLTEDQLTGIGQALSQKVLLKRFGQSAEIAKAATFLSSSNGSYVNGIELTVDGGVGINTLA